jgi:tetratricopeptide (TPR) repeat protein
MLHELLYNIIIGKHKDAIKSFERSLDYTPNSADAHTNIASAYLMLRDTTNAIKHLEQASNFNPLDGEVQYNLACVYEATGNLDDAKIRFERASIAGIDKADAALEKLAKKME